MTSSLTPTWTIGKLLVHSLNRLETRSTEGNDSQHVGRVTATLRDCERQCHPRSSDHEFPDHCREAEQNPANESWVITTSDGWITSPKRCPLPEARNPLSEPATGPRRPSVDLLPASCQEIHVP